MAMEWRQFALLLLVALAGKVTRGQQPAATVASCFAGTGCSGSVVSQNTIWRDCCQGSAPAQSFVGINGQCRDCSELVVEFAATSYTVSEGAEFVTLEVVKWGETTNEIILNFTLGMEGDSAEGGDDFGPFPEPVVSVLAFLPSNDTTLSFGVQLREDSIVESTESFTVRLELTSLLPLPPGLQLGLNEATVTIIDNDVVNVTVLPENLVVNVEEGQQQLTFTLIRSGQTVRDVTVMVRTQPGSAQDPEDFVSHSELVSFAVLEEVRTISITVNDDSIVESTEEFFVLLEVPPDETGVMIPQSSSSVFIIDNDRLTLGFTSAVSSVSEATGSISVEVTKVGMNERPVAVAFSTQNGTATDTEDFTAVQGILEFGPEDTLPILINVSMDGIFEDEDSFTITLSVPVNETGVILGQATSTVTIFDSDSVTVGFEVNTLDVSEEVGVVVIQVSLLEGVLARDIDVQLDCISGQATAGEDFSCPAMTFTFNDNISEQNVSIGVEDDGFFEGTENFVVTLQSPVFGVQIEPAVVDITISDNEDLRIRFDQEVYSVSETENSVEVTVILNVSLNRPLEVFLVTVDGTATGGSDYVSLNQTLRFTSSVLQQRAQITLTDDILNDGVEFFLLQLLPASDDLGAFRSLAEATVEIEDNERIIIEFGQTTYTVDEGDRFVSLIMTKSGVTLQDFLVQVTLEDRSALGGRDYGPFPDPMIQINALMLANDTEIVVGILIREDAIIEDTESFVASLQVSPGTFPGNNTNATVYILDNDVVDITLTPETITVDERDGSVTFTVSRDRDTVLNRAVTILFMTESGSASSGFDFDSVVQILTFTSDVNELSVSVPINNDFIAEGLEQFSAILSGEPEPAARIVQNTSTVFIADDDVVQVEFDRVEYSVSEDAEFVSINVLKTGQSAIAITVEVATADGTATAPFDYNATVTEVTFETFDTERVVSLQLIDDAVFEGDEVFFVNLFAQNSEDPIMLGNRTTARITITENDFVVIQFAVSAYTVDEIDGIVVITVIKQMNNSRPVTVMLLTEPGTATAPLDYGAVAMDIEFQPGAEEQQSIDILIIDDVFNERTEFFTARLEVPSAETGVILGSINMSSITIIDNDPLGVGFELASYTVIEGGAVQVCISQQGNSMRAVNVTVATRAGTAIGGVDFQTKIGILSLEPPATQVCCDIQTLPDSQQESVEMFEVVLLQASEGVSIFRDTAIVSITDRNCSLIIAIEQETYRVGEGDASAVTVCVTTESEVVVQAELATLPSVDPGPPLFNSTTNLLNFQPPGDRECCTIPLNNNEIGLEGERSFGVLLSVSSSIPGVLCIGTSEATVVVTDDDNVIVEFASANYTVNEADGALLVCVRKNRDTAIDFSVTIMPTESSPPQAEESSDFDPSPRSISLDAQESVACTSITIISDGIPEGAEIFIVQLELPEIMGLQLGPISEAIVTIIDGPSTPSPPTPVLGNDTVIGDPLFTVPLRLTSASQSLLRNIIRRRLRNRLPNLCYEIHGSAGSFFNLVSDVCTSVNAFYTSANISQDLNVITAIGIRAVNLRQSCIDIRISVEDDCMPSVTEPGGQEFSTSQYNSDGISVSRFGQKVRVVVPNCENVDLVMWITCREVNSNRMMRFVITRGVNLRPTSHGFLGQFWNVPINVERFVPTREDPYFLEEELFVITVNPMDSQQRRFVAELYDQVWDTTLGVCFYAGSIQAGPVAEIDEPNDSVIQGVYSDYHVSGLFDSEFMYSQFSDSRCT